VSLTAARRHGLLRMIAISDRTYGSNCEGVVGLRRFAGWSRYKMVAMCKRRCRPDPEGLPMASIAISVALQFQADGCTPSRMYNIHPEHLFILHLQHPESIRYFPPFANLPHGMRSVEATFLSYISCSCVSMRAVARSKSPSWWISRYWSPSRSPCRQARER
jgi:hypothetical protein